MNYVIKDIEDIIKGIFVVEYVVCWGWDISIVDFEVSNGGNFDIF